MRTDERRYLDRLAEAERARLGLAETRTADLSGFTTTSTPVADFPFLKSIPSARVTVGIVYLAGRPDTEGEYAEEQELRRAVEGFMAKPISERPAFLEHDRRRRAGDVLTAETLWDDVETTLYPRRDQPGRKIRLPRGSVIASVRWREWAWPSVRDEKIGFSLGGRARRVIEEG
jgi:hypothetical protein